MTVTSVDRTEDRFPGNAVQRPKPDYCFNPYLLPSGAYILAEASYRDEGVQLGRKFHVTVPRCGFVHSGAYQLLSVIIRST